MPDVSSSASEARYLVTARKYRPALFKELAAQEHVTDTLKNALRLDRLAHAYLFSGPRGVGKTTAARILAKAINCTTPLAEREDEAEPCRECESCRSFEEGRSLGIFELDAASNNKVDDIRELRETVRVPPQGAKRKVYIIDEVHMLSNQAFNALLKTLEEPPPHVLFIFATTEPHKVLPTILSRCQRFDFRRIPAGRIARHLEQICQQEDIDADEGSLMLLARKGDGALRDALSAFDQAVSLCGDTLRYDDLAQALGVVDADLYFDATGHVRDSDSAGMLRLVEAVVQRGYDLQEVLTGLSEHLRNLLVARTMEDVTLIEATDATRRRYKQAAGHFSEDDLLRLLLIAGEAEEEVRQSAQPRLRLEMALLKMATLPHAADLQAALAKLDRLEQMAQDGALADLSEAGEAPSSNVADASASEEDGGRADDASREASPASAPPEPTLPEDTGAPKEAEEAASTDEPALSPSAPDAQAPDAQAPDAQAPDDVDEAGAEAPQLSTSPASEPGDAEAPSASTGANPERPEKGDAGEEAGRDEGGAPEDDSAAGNAAPGNAAPGGASEAGQGGEADASTTSAYNDLFDPPALDGRESSPAGAGDNTASKNSVAGDGAEGGAPAAALVDIGDGEAAPSPEGSAAVTRLRDRWDALVDQVRDGRIDVASYLCDAAPISLSGRTLTLAVPNSFSRRFLLDQESFLLDHVEKHLPEATTVPSALRFTLKAPSEEDAGADEDALLDPHAVMQQLREDDPVVKAIFEEFGGEMAW